jgi:LPXTG-site transpeptidase (sortase) family protein
MNLFALIAFCINATHVSWTDLAMQQIDHIMLSRQIYAERLAIQARFTHSKAFTLAGVEDIRDTYAFRSRLEELRKNGEYVTAEMLEKLEEQALEEEQKAQTIAGTNVTVALTPDTENTTGESTPSSSGQGTTTSPTTPGTPALPTPGQQQPIPALPTPGGTSSPALPTPDTSQEPSGTPGVQGPGPVPDGSKEYRLSIPKLDIYNVPVIKTDIMNEDRFLSDLKNGVAQDFCNPGEPCKNVIFGHSSGYRNDPSKYKQIFARLNELNNGDHIVVDYKGKRYTYVVFKKEIVAPDAIGILRNYNYEELTLFTCWPINTWQKRLVLYTKRL